MTKRPGFKPTQYMRQEKAITAADTGSIRERWFWGLRLLRDPYAFNSGSSQLRPGVADQLITEATKCGYKLSASEIRYRLQCARTYPTEAQIHHVSGEFQDWTALRNAGFPPIPPPPDEPPADHRTRDERDRDTARALLDLVGEQGTLFPLDQFEPQTSTLKQMREYLEEQEALTARFAAKGRKRRAYWERLKSAVDGDEDATWIDAHNLAFPEADS